MDRAKGSKKRTVPISYQQSQQTKYEAKSKNNNSKRQNQQQKSNEIDDEQLSFDNYSNQQFMQSSYKQKYSERKDKLSNYGNSYNEENFLQDQAKQYGFDQNKKSSKRQSFNHYDLTFKKNTGEMPDDQILYDQSDKPSLNQLQDESQSFQQVKYDPNNIDSAKKYFDQFSNLESLIQNREKLYQKYHNALINFYYLHAKLAKSIEQKHKEYLLSLLVQQLQKNIFINGLKLNYHRVKVSKESKQEQVQVVEQAKSKLQAKLKSSGKGVKQQKDLNQSYLEQFQAKLLIFQQITYGMIRKKLFQCFDCILTISKRRVQKSSGETHQRKKNQQQDQVLKQECRDDSQFQQSEEIYESFQSEKGNKKDKRSYLNSQQISNRQKSSQRSCKSKAQSSLKSKIHELDSNNLNEFDNSQLSNQEDQEQEDGQSIQQDNGQLSEEDLQGRKLHQLINYINSLKNEALQTDSQLKRYFIKWKIYNLQLILEEYFKQDQNDSQNYQEQSNSQSLNNLDEQCSSYLESQNKIQKDDYVNKHQKRNINPITLKKQSSRQQLQKVSKFQNNISNYLEDSKLENRAYQIKQGQPQDSIKQKFLILKSFLYENALNQFWNNFSEFSTHQKLMIVSQKLREQKLKKNALFGLQLNIEWNQKQRLMTEYYHQISEQQNLSQYRTAELFYRTNLKIKCFFQFTRTCRQVKCLKKIDSLTVKICFHKIDNFANAVKRKQLNIQRFFIMQKNKRIFKPFQAWKDSTIRSPNYIKLKTFSEKKNSQILTEYFSILQLIHKASLVQQKKASNFYKSKQLQKAFKYLDFISKQSGQIKVKQRELQEYLIFRKGKQFLDNFYEFYGEKVLQHRMNIRAQKLFYSRQKEFIYEKMQQWRNFVIKKQSYQAIEYRLIKLRQKQVKQHIFQIWMDELDKRLNKKDQLQQSAQHKDWLVKYYGSLCQIATSGKIND